MIDPFVYTALPARVVFGRGTLATLADEVGAARHHPSPRAGHGRPSRGRGEHRGLAARTAADVFAAAVMHTPIEVTERAMAVVRDRSIDGLVAVGGGSTIGLGKALALRTDLPQIAVPTTYAGSEMTPILGETQNGAKVTQRSPRILPETVLYDVELTLSLPAALSGVSGINGIAHGVEALYAESRNPVTALMAVEGIAALARALPRIVDAPADSVARSEALYGAWLCGTCLGTVGMALHHKLCHVLGGMFDLPHAETHTAVLAHAVAYNASAAPDAMARIAVALGAANAAQGLYDLAVRVGARTALRDLGMPEGGIERVIERTLAEPYWNPRPLKAEPLRALLRAAWEGRPPG